jgi:DNA-binding NtrC family response regulator
LRLIQEKEYYPLGGDQAIKANSRFIFATNVNLQKAVSEGKFRKDLYFRLHAHHIIIPSLSKRRDDLSLLVDYFISKGSKELGKNKPGIPKQLISHLKVYSFPGNVRELEGLIYDALVRHESGILSLKHFQKIIGNQEETIPWNKNGSTDENGIPESEVFKNLETLPSLKQGNEWLIKEAMNRAGGNQTIAAKILGIDRTALNKRLKKYSKPL